MKNFIIGLSVFLAVLIVGLIVASLTINSQHTVRVELGGRDYLTRAFLNDQVATSTKGDLANTYLKLGFASSTLETSTDNIDQIDLNLWVVASSTSAKVNWNLEFSHNGDDWFGEDGLTVTSDVLVTHGSNQLMHTWTSGKTATNTTNITITPVASKFMRVNFNSSNAQSWIWAELIKREKGK